MAVQRVKLAITKMVPWRSGMEETANVYTYDSVDTASSTAMNGLADAVVSAEKAIFGNGVNFTKAQLWSVGVGINYMYLSKALTGAGTSGINDIMYAECAILVSWPLPRSTVLTRAARRDLRKYLHTCRLHGYQTTGQESTARGKRAATTLNTYMDAVAEPVSGIKLCAPNGDLPTGQGGIAGYLEHRQFPRGRKRVI
jgi:hypothetical protein